MADLLIDAIESFIITLDKERNFSLHTIKAYKNDLNRFNSFLNQGISRIILKKINRNDIRKFLSDEYDNNFTSKTVARRLATIKSFFKYLVKIELIEENIAIHINSPKVAKKLPSFINKSLIDVLMNSPSLDTLIGVRDRAVLELFYSTGMRLSELVNINIGDFHLNKKLLRVIGKGNKERILPVYSEALSSVESWIQAGRVKILGHKFSNALFLNSRGNRLTRQGFWRILKHESERAGISESVTPHTIRHSFATHLLQGGASLLHVQSLLGHSSISTTQIYTHLTDEHVRLEYHKAHPRA